AYRDQREKQGKREKEVRSASPPSASAPMSVPAGPSLRKRASPFNRSFTWAAVVTMLLYLLLCWPIGVIANLMWLSEAEAIYRRTGTSPPGRGCLKLLGVVFVLLPFVALVLGILSG